LARPQGSLVAVVATTNRVRKVITITGLDTFIYMGESVAEALRATKIR
jgi:translation initiation factor 1 (eIF-1/SUI1)